MRPLNLLVLFAAACCCLNLSAYAGQDSLKVHSDFLYFSGKHFRQDILYQSGTAFSAVINIRCFKVNDKNDSLLLYRKRTGKLDFGKGTGMLKIDLNPVSDSGWIRPAFGDIIKKTSALPAGNYYLDISIFSLNDTIQRSFLREIDSSLSFHSDLRRQLDNVYAPETKRTVLGIGLLPANPVGPENNTLSLLQRSARKVDRLFKSKGMIISHRQFNGSDYTDVWYKDWFIGYYDVDLRQSLASTIQTRRQQIADNASSFAKTELLNVQSIFSQTKNNKKAGTEDKEAVGEIGVTGYMGSGQEEYASVENNYYELRGRLETPILNIPVSIEGFYTSQDKNRTAKASYVRVHYDVEKSKAELMKLISGYKGKYEEVKSRGQGLDAVYQVYIAQLQGEKTRLTDSLKQESGLRQIDPAGVDKEGLKQQLAGKVEAQLADTAALRNKLDSSGKADQAVASAGQIKDSVDRLYQKSMSKYRQIQDLEKKITRYQKLLDQYKNTNYFDSLMAYDKLKDLESGDEQSYRQLVKKAGNLLPDGKAKKFITGLTSLDAGIINKNLSSYTMSGQTVKGLDLQYDLGFCETGFTVGRTEYISREGNVDKYTCYSGRAMFKPAKGQKATLSYYGYTPSRKMLTDESFFSNVDGAMPSFRSPVHIISAAYDGIIRKNIHFETEVAASLRKQDSGVLKAIPFTDKMAYNIKLEGNIPRTNISMEASYEHAGNSFENNSLPVSMSGTERYRIGTQASFFRSFLTLGIEYNYLQQESFATKGGNSRWGFEIKTTSRRYPSLSLSYKPFSTFRSYSDTLAIPQRPLIGAVWTGKASYQIKKKGYSLRFTGMYNKNSSEMDTVNYGSSVFQFGVIYMKSRLSAMINIGNIASVGSDISEADSRTNFVNMGVSYVLSTQWSVNLGQDIGIARYGLSKYGVNAGCAYRMKRIPLSIRPNFRFATYKAAEERSWRQLYGGSIDVLWQFKLKLKD